MDAREYLDFERNSPERHELIDGEIVAMSGGTLAHSVISANLAAELRAALRDRPCLVASLNLRVKVAAAEFFTYPDVTVVCGTRSTGKCSRASRSARRSPRKLAARGHGPSTRDDDPPGGARGIVGIVPFQSAGIECPRVDEFTGF